MSEVIEKIIAETLASGVKPIERKYRGVYDGYGENPIAYVGETEVFTTASGVLTDYQSAIEDHEIGIKWSIGNVKSAIRALDELEKAENRPAFIAAFVTRSFLESDVAENLAAFEETADERKERICLIFSENALESAIAEKGASEARGAGFKTAIDGFSGERSLAALTACPTDYVFFSEKMTALAGDRNKPGVFTAFTSLLRSLRTEIILTGVRSDDQIREAIAAECFGIMPSKDYAGEFDFPTEARDLESIKKDGEASL